MYKQMCTKNMYKQMCTKNNLLCTNSVDPILWQTQRISAFDIEVTYRSSTNWPVTRTMWPGGITYDCATQINQNVLLRFYSKLNLTFILLWLTIIIIIKFRYNPLFWRQTNIHTHIQKRLGGGNNPVASGPLLLTNKLYSILRKMAYMYQKPRWSPN